MRFVQRRLLKAVLGVVARPRLTLLIAGIFLAAGIALAWFRLTLSTDQNKLFSPHAPFFQSWLEFNRKFPENQALYVLVESKNPAKPPPVERWVALADALTARLRAMPSVVRSVDSRVPLHRLAGSGQALLFDSTLSKDFYKAGQASILAKIWNTPGGSSIEQFLSFKFPFGDFSQLAERLASGWNRALAHPDEPIALGSQVPDLIEMDAASPDQLGYYVDKDYTDPRRQILLVRVYPIQNTTSLAGHAVPVETIKEACAETAKSFDEFTVGVTGRPAIEADEMRTADRDSNRAETLAIVTVFAGLVFMLRSVWLALAAEICLGVGIGWTFGWATLSVGELNLLSIVFIIALIGIGMDYLVQLLMRYRVEARRYVRPMAVWARVFRYASPPTLTACLGAAGAFFVSIFTDFRGAAELGIIASGGLLLCLLSGYTVLPALLVLFPPKLKPYAPDARYKEPAPPRSLARGVALPVIWIGLLLAGIPWAMKTRFNSSLLDLQAPHLPSVELVNKLQTWSAVVLSGDLEILRQARSAVESSPLVATTQSILDAYDNLHWLQSHQNEAPNIQWPAQTPIAPADLPRLADRANSLAQRVGPGDAADALKRFAQSLTAAHDPDLAARRLTQCQEMFTDEMRRLLAQLSPKEVDIAALPSELRDHYVYQDPASSQLTFALYINPRENLWDGANLDSFMQDITSRIDKMHDSPTVTGIAADIYHTTKAVQQSFYKAALYALILILILVWLDLRSLPQTLLAVSVLAAGLPMLIILMGLTGTSWNFANFFALPILIGAGHEYGVFLMHRYREASANPRRVWRRWDASDQALLLCAFVTSSSFGFFWWTSDHEGLRSLGLVMAVGSACIYLAAVMVVRPLLMLRLEMRRRQKLLGKEREHELLTPTP